VAGGAFLTFGGVLFFVVARSPTTLYNTWNGFFVGGMLAGFLCFAAGLLILTDSRRRRLWGWVAFSCSLVGVFLGFGGLVVGTFTALAGGLMAIALGNRISPSTAHAYPELTESRKPAQNHRRTIRQNAQLLAALAVGLITVLAGLPYLTADAQTTSFLFAHPEVYDLQMIYTDGNWTRGMSYSIVATLQPSDCSYGFAYLVNGYTYQNYWYQVGLAYDWFGGTNSFQLVYEVFGPSGLSVYPNAGGGAGLGSFSRAISPGDSILLNLSLSDGSIVMSGYDQQTGGRASGGSYSSESATSFQAGGDPTPGGGTFTGLMTECYRSIPFGFDLANATYHDVGPPQPKGVVFIDEWDFSWGRYPLFGVPAFPRATSAALNLTSPGLQVFSAYSIVTWANSTDFSAATYE
jgi:hypothetical protein